MGLPTPPSVVPLSETTLIRLEMPVAAYNCSVATNLWNCWSLAVAQCSLPNHRFVLQVLHPKDNGFGFDQVVVRVSDKYYLRKVDPAQPDSRQDIIPDSRQDVIPDSEDEQQSMVSAFALGTRDTVSPASNSSAQAERAPSRFKRARSRSAQRSATLEPAAEFTDSRGPRKSARRRAHDKPGCRSGSQDAAAMVTRRQQQPELPSQGAAAVKSASPEAAGAPSSSMRQSTNVATVPPASVETVPATRSEAHITGRGRAKGRSPSPPGSADTSVVASLVWASMTGLCKHAGLSVGAQVGFASACLHSLSAQQGEAAAKPGCSSPKAALSHSGLAATAEASQQASQPGLDSSTTGSRQKANKAVPEVLSSGLGEEKVPVQGAISPGSPSTPPQEKQRQAASSVQVRSLAS